MEIQLLMKQEGILNFFPMRLLTNFQMDLENLRIQESKIYTKVITSYLLLMMLYPL